MSYYSISAKEVLSGLKTSEKGLTSKEAEERLQKYGQNILEDDSKIHPLKIILEQFKSPVVWVLLGAMSITFFLKEFIDFWVIFAVVIINAIFGFWQEYRAEEAIKALKKLTSLKATVLRDGVEKEIDASLLVPGDIILLETGDKVPADARIIESLNLEIQQASLTGESNSVEKNEHPLKNNLSIADQNNMVFSTTIVTKGHAKAVITSTGMNTEIGKIAKLLKETKQEETALQKQLKILAKNLTIGVIIIGAVVLSVDLFLKKEFIETFTKSVALAVAAIPEGLPAVVTISLALGIQRMTKKNALIRKLPSVETLGSCSVICTDKTGTLTHNEMTVKQIYVDKSIINVGGSGYEPEGIFTKTTKNLNLLLEIGALNNNSKVRRENEEWTVIGDPTEAALLVCASKAKINVENLHEKYPRTGEIEFSSERKRMTTIHKFGSKKVAYVKGAPEVILELCNRISINGDILRLSREDKKKVLEINEDFAKRSLRVLAFAYKEVSEDNPLVEEQMIFVGLQAMIDPPRREARDAIKKCESAGIKVVMITGDNLATAVAIAKDLGLKGKAITGSDLEKLENYEDNVEEFCVYARVDPVHKLKIVEALQNKGHVVAMTGDGVNDAPALKKSDIGIAMGSGTDVAKEASHMILADDNFSSIVNAVEEGRTVYDNIKKFVEYLLSSNIGEVLTIFFASVFALSNPLIARQILWINLATDLLPATALSVEPAERDIMKRKPREKREGILNNSRVIMILLSGIVMTLGTLIVFQIYNPELNLAKAQTMAFTTLIMYQMFNVFNQRSENTSIFKLGWFSNKWLIAAVLISIALQVLVIYVPFLQNAFGTVPLQWIDWIWVILVSSTVLVFGEIVKIMRRV
ncbi:MAG: calcium-translocating P-type ATPase, SERCA-type [Nanoarchaeota archaeon]